jgi:hypothetical protein
VPYNGSGTFTLPAGNPVVTGTTISSVTTNNTNNDIANGLSNAVTRNGQSPPTANLPMGGFHLTGLSAGTASGDSVNYEQTTLKTSSTGAVIVPSGTTAQRDASPAVGYVRYNTDLGSYEAYNGTTWVLVAADTATTGSSIIPVGTLLQRDTLPSIGYFRFNTTYNTYEGVKLFTGNTISSITRVNTLATVTTATDHGRATLDAVIISGASDSLYNGKFSITVISPTQFTYVMTAIPAASPATGTIVYSYYQWGSVGGGAGGGGSDQVFIENSIVVTTDYTLTTGKNAMSTGPITINSGVTITVPSTQRWVVL